LLHGGSAAIEDVIVPARTLTGIGRRLNQRLPKLLIERHPAGYSQIKMYLIPDRFCSAQHRYQYSQRLARLCTEHEHDYVVQLRQI